MKTRNTEEERERLSKILAERLEAHDENRKATQEKLHKFCNGLTTETNVLEEKVSRELEEKFTAEDNRLQTVLGGLCSDDNDEVSKMIQKAKSELLVMRSYKVVKRIFYEYGYMKFSIPTLCNLETERWVVPEIMELMRPTDIHISKAINGEFSLRFTCIGPDEMWALFEHGIESKVRYKCLLSKRGENGGREYVLKKAEGDCFKFSPGSLDAGATYSIRVKLITEKKECEWSDEAEFLYKCDGIEELIPSENRQSLEKLDEEREAIKRMLSERIEILEDNKAALQEKLQKICEGLRTEVGKLEERVNNELKVKYTAEDKRLQTSLSELRTAEVNEISKVVQRAKVELLVEQTYVVTKQSTTENEDGDIAFKFYQKWMGIPAIQNYYNILWKPNVNGDESGGETEEEDDKKQRLWVSSLCELRTERKIASLEVIDFEERKPRSLIPSFTEKGELSLFFAFFDEDEAEVLKKFNSPFEVEVKMWVKGHEKGTSRKFIKELTPGNGDGPICFRSTFMASTTYCLKMRIVQQGMRTQWSDEAEFTTPEFKECCVWKECTNYIDWYREYSIVEKNPRIATKINGSGRCTIIGNTALPLNKVTSWSIKILKSEGNDGRNIYIGVGPFDIDQSKDYNYDKCGWYFYCYDSTLRSGPPHNYDNKEYGQRKEDGEYVHTGDSVGVMMDTAKGELSFILNGVNLGVAYEGIPLDKPLVPCVLLGGDSVELDFSEVKENVDSSIPAPSNITTNGTTWDSITLTWDAVEEASFYQIEVDGSKFWDASTTNAFTKRELLPETEHTFRVRVVEGNSVSEWSDVGKEKTQKAQDFSECTWKECPDYVDKNRRYSVGVRNPKIATKINDGNADDNDVKEEEYYSYCTIIGNTPLPLKVISWSIKILKPKKNDGNGIFIGVAPSDIDQNEDYNFDKCGWYFNCYSSTLISGPPHNYKDKAYGPRKYWGGYVHTKDNVGVVMDTARGELSFILNGVNVGVAYEGIPLDKPLVPCVILECDKGSIKLDTSEVKENVDNSIPVPSNITAKSGITWDSITLAWDAVEGASFYQIEMNGSKFWDVSTTTSFTERGLLPETEHTFRVRAVRGNSVGEWNDVMKVRTQKELFETSFWKECPDDVYEERKYSVDEENPRIATKIGYGYECCTIIGNTPLPLNKVTSWSIKILKSEENDGNSIFIGVAPSDIGQNDWNNNKCGWYFDCFGSTLWPGPPYNYNLKEYGPRKEDGEYVHTGDSVGVVMDTEKGELSFELNGVNLGVAYEGIPLNKPLVSCVLLYYKGDSVELVI